MNAISKDIVWDKLDGRKMSAVILKTSGDFTEKSDWPRQFSWLKDYLEKFTTTFKQIIRQI